MQILNTVFRRRTGPVWPSNSPYYGDLSAWRHCFLGDVIGWLHRFRKAGKLISLLTHQNLIGSMPNKLTAVIKNKKDPISYQPRCSRRGQRHRLTLTFVGHCYAIFDSGII